MEGASYCHALIDAMGRESQPESIHLSGNRNVLSYAVRRVRRYIFDWFYSAANNISTAARVSH